MLLDLGIIAGTDNELRGLKNKQKRAIQINIKKKLKLKVFLSIKPEFANLIFERKKKFEFRRTIFKP